MSGQLRSRARDFALLGGRPAFASTLHVGQMHFPSWDRYAEAIHGICEREWYTNHGPLAVEAERRLAEFLGVRNAVCVSNATVGLMMAAKALGLDGAVVVPAFTAPATAQALVWAGTQLRFCDVEAGGFHSTPESVRAVLDDDVQAVVAVNLWGDTADVGALEALAREHRVSLFFDSAHAFGCAIAGRPVGGFGALEVFSFHAENIVNTAEGGCVSTDDDELAARLRNIRSSYGAGHPVPVPITSNGRFSEAQAALTLLALDDLERNSERNRAQLDAYAEGIAEIPGLRLVTPARVDRSNYQSAVVAVDTEAFGLSRGQLHRVLLAENVGAVRPFGRVLHRTTVFGPLGAGASQLPHAEHASSATLQLPLGAPVEEDDVARIVGLLEATHRSARRLAGVLSASSAQN